VFIIEGEKIHTFMATKELNSMNKTSME
jgi:hypothetical protein